MRKAKWVCFGLSVAVVLVIVFRNLEQTNVELIFTTLSLPLAALLAVTLLIGFILGFSANALLKVRHWRAKSRKESASHASDSEK